MGYDVDHHMIRRIETGERFVTDIELALLAQALNTSINELCRAPEEPKKAPCPPPEGGEQSALALCKSTKRKKRRKKMPNKTNDAGIS